MKFVLFFLFVVLCSAKSFCQTCDLQKGMVAYYPFIGGGVNDESGHGINGINHGVEIGDARCLNESSAAFFGGKYEYIEIPGGRLNIGRSDFSIVVWVQLIKDSVIFFSHGNFNCGQGYRIMQLNGHVMAEVSDGSNHCVVSLQGQTPVTDGYWHCIIFTVERKTGAKLYIDGTLNADTLANTDFDLNDAQPASIGWRIRPDSNALNREGQMDDVYIYNRVLNPAEVQYLSKNCTPAIYITSNADTSACFGDTIKFTANVQNIGGPIHYAWKINGVTQPNSDSTVFSTLGLVPGDTIECVITIISACGNLQFSSNKIGFHATYITKPVITITAGNAGQCEGDTVTFNASVANQGLQPVYHWRINGVNKDDNAPVFTPAGLHNGDVVTCMLYSSKVCADGTGVLSNAILMQQTPTVTPAITVQTQSTTICEGNDTRFYATSTGGGSAPAFRWMVNGVPVNVTGSVFTSNTLKNGNIVSCNMVSNATCVTTRQVISNADTITVNPKPHPALGNDTTICTGVSYVLIPGNYTAYLWQNGSTGSSFLVNRAGTYAVTATNNCGTGSAIVTVAINSCNVMFPTAFTPNGDGRNDYFKVLNGYGIISYRMQIFNRFGNCVFETADPQKGWDGTYNGHTAPAGTYIFVCNYVNRNGTSKQFVKGTLVLLR